MRQGDSWVKGFLAHGVPFKPGTHFVYISSAYRFIFKGKQLLWERELNVSFGPAKLETLKGVSVDELLH